jgi:terminase large subunit-like protein
VSSALVKEIRRARDIALRRSERSDIPDDPIEFAGILGLKADPWQERLLRSGSDRILLNCCRQSGKSTMAGLLALHKALTVPDSLVLCLAPSERQSKELFAKVTTFFRALGQAELTAADSYRKLGMALANGSRIEALPGTEKTIRGFSGASLLVVDEAARVADELYYSVRPMLAVSGGALIMMSTPYGKRGIFHEEWTEGHGWDRYEVTAAECPRIPEMFIEEERRTMPEWWFAQEYLCEFRETEEQVFSHDMIEAARADELPEYRFEGDETLWS